MFEKLKDILVHQEEWLNKPLTDPWYEHEFCYVLEDECWRYINSSTKYSIDEITFELYNGKVSEITVWISGEDEEGNSDSFDYTPQRILEEFKYGQQYMEIENDEGEIELVEQIFLPKEMGEALIEFQSLLQQLYPLLDRVYGPILKAEDDDFVVHIDGCA